MKFMIILINWKHEEQTLRALRSLRDWKTLKPLICVIDNESTQTSKALLSSKLNPDELICSETNLGYAGGNNLGIDRALREQCEYVLLLNADAEISEAAAIALFNRLRMHAEISILGPVLIEEHLDSNRYLAGGRDIARFEETRWMVEPCGIRKMAGHPLREVDYVSGTVFLVRAELFNHLGLLDEEYFFSGEIADFCKRARDAGFKCCVDLEVTAHHYLKEQDGTMRNTLYLYYSLRNRFLYISKHHQSQRLKLKLNWLKIAWIQFMRAILNRQMAKARAIFRATQDGLAMRFGNQNGRFEKSLGQRVA